MVARRGSIDSAKKQPLHGRHEFGLLGHRSLNLLTAASCLLLALGVGIFVRTSSLASSPEIKSGISAKYGTDYCMDNWQGRIVNGNPVDIFLCNGTGAQQWSVNSSNHTITIGGKCLDVSGQNTANGATVAISTCNGQANQYWTFGSNYSVVSKQSGKCLDDPGASNASNTHLQIWTCNQSVQQVWYQWTYTPPTPPPPPPPPPTPTPATPPPPTPTPVPHPTPTPTPGGGGGGVTPTPTPGGGGVTPTPNPGGGSGGGSGGSGGGSGGGGFGGGSGGGSGGGGGVGGPMATPGTAAPSAPKNFMAAVTGSSSLVLLSWDAALDPYASSPIITYGIDRSLDQTNWEPIATGISTLKYSDTAAKFNVHYYYRLNAEDDAGNGSDYVYADVTTPSFTSNVTAGGTSTYTSSDGVASVDVPQGAVPGDANCGVALDSQTLKVTSNKKVVAGPFQLVCKDQAGNIIADFNSPVAWTINLKGKLKGVKNPAAYNVKDDGSLTPAQNANYDSKGEKVTVSSSNSEAVAVLADPIPGLPWNVIAFVLVVLGVVGGLAVIVLRKQRDVSYVNYLRRKYYEI
jgi:uncharacterized membrane protein YgcG